MDAFQAILAWQGVLDFRADPVPTKLVNRLLEAATAAPSPANTQSWEWIAIDDPSLIQALIDHLIKTQEEGVFHHLLDTPPGITRKLIKLYQNLDQAPWWIVVSRHQRVQLAPPELAPLVRDWDLCALGAALGNLMSAAASLDLGTRWFGNPMLDPEPIKALLKIPEQVEVIAATPLGYHDQPPKERPPQSLQAQHDFNRGDKYHLAALLKGRLPLEKVTHHNRYGQ